MRKARRERDLLARLPQRDQVPDFADEQVGHIDDADTLAFVREARRALRTAEREVDALCVWAGLDYAAAAQALGIPIGTIRSRLSRARRKLARLSTSAGAARNPAPAGHRQNAAPGCGADCQREGNG